MLNIQIDSGKILTVHAFSFGLTYGSLLCGVPNERLNRSIFEKAAFPENWGERKTLKIKPSDEEFENTIKPVCYSAWLNCSEPSDPKFNGSELVVIWFDYEPSERSVEEIIKKGISGIDWNIHACDFSL